MTIVGIKMTCLVHAIRCARMMLDPSLRRPKLSSRGAIYRVARAARSLSMRDMKNVSLLSVLALVVGCAKARSEDAAPPHVKSAEPSGNPRTEPAPLGWQRLVLRDLDPPIAATVLVPAQSKAVSAASECPDVDGNPFATVEVTISLPDDSRITLSTCPTLGAAPTPPEIERQMGPSTLVARDEAPSGEWAMSFNREDVITKIRSVVTIGWSPQARIVCQGGSLASDPLVAPRARRICTSVAPDGAPLAPNRDPSIAYPGVRDPEVLALLERVQQATSRDDVAGFVELVDPSNTTLREQLAGSADDLTARHPGKALHAYLLLDGCGANTTDARCRWIAKREGNAIVFVPDRPIHPESTPRLYLRRTADGWRIAELLVN